MTAVLTVSNAKKTFGEKTALNDVSLELRQGEWLGLLGPNGAGKTTLFRLLMGILKATTGSWVRESNAAWAFLSSSPRTTGVSRSN